MRTGTPTPKIVADNVTTGNISLSNLPVGRASTTGLEVWLLVMIAALIIIASYWFATSQYNTAQKTNFDDD